MIADLEPYVFWIRTNDSGQVNVTDDLKIKKVSIPSIYSHFLW